MYERLITHPIHIHYSTPIRLFYNKDDMTYELNIELQRMEYLILSCHQYFRQVKCFGESRKRATFYIDINQTYQKEKNKQIIRYAFGENVTINQMHQMLYSLLGV